MWYKTEQSGKGPVTYWKGEMDWPGERERKREKGRDRKRKREIKKTRKRERETGTEKDRVMKWKKNI